MRSLAGATDPFLPVIGEACVDDRLGRLTSRCVCPIRWDPRTPRHTAFEEVADAPEDVILAETGHAADALFNGG